MPPRPDPDGPPHGTISPAGLPAPGLTTLFGGVLVVAILYVARDLLMPLVMAVLLSFVLAPLIRLLRRLRLPNVLATLIGVVMGFAVILGLGGVMGQQLTQLARELPAYQDTVQAKLQTIQDGGTGLVERATSMLRDLGRGAAGEAPAGPAPAPRLEGGGRPIPVEIRQPDTSPLQIVRNVVEPLLGPLATTAIVLIFVVFVLLYREDLRDRLIRLFGARDLHRTMAAMDDAALRLSRFFLTQTALNSGYGVLMGLVLWGLGVPHPVLWGILAGLMRFVPFVGTLVAVVFPALLAMAVDPGWSLALVVLGVFLSAEFIMGQAIEPWLYGHSTGLSPIAVIVAATFWTWLWGPVGLLLATPLTVCLVVLGRHVQMLEFLDVMLGDRPPLQPAETFYQRALAGDADGLTEQAERSLRDIPLSAYYDDVAVASLCMVQADVHRRLLDDARIRTIRASVTELIEDLSDTEDEPPVVAPLAAGPVEPAEGSGAEALSVPELRPSWAAPGAVLCIPGRGRMDDLITAMLAQLLGKYGFGARVEDNDSLRSANIARLETRGVRAVVLATLDGGSSPASTRYLLRRLRRHFPDAAVLVGVWRGDADSAVLAAVREEGGLDGVATSLREAVERCGAAAARAAGPAPAPGPRADDGPAPAALFRPQAPPAALPAPDALPGAAPA